LSISQTLTSYFDIDRIKPAVNSYKDDIGPDFTSKDVEPKTSEPPATKKLKFDDDLSIDGDFFQPENETSSDESIPDQSSEDEDITPISFPTDDGTPTRKGRQAAKKGAGPMHELHVR
jgi:hypothetical protein